MTTIMNESDQININDDYISSIDSFIEHEKNIYSDSVENCLRQHKQKLKNKREDLKKNKEHLKQLKENIDSTNRNLNDVKIESAKLKDKTLHLEKLIHEKEELALKLESMKAVVAEEKRKLQDANESKEAFIEDINKSVALYKKHLGIQVTTTSRQTLIFSFIQIDKNNPEKEYYLELEIEDEKYKILCTAPEVNELTAIEEHLNASQNLLSCLVQIRKLFCKSVSNNS